MESLVRGEDGRARCVWGSGPADYRDYHDAEWGRAVHGDTALFERLSLEAFQSGLSWLTILRKREGFRRAFSGFDPQRVADYEERDIERLMGDASIVRNRRKIEATISNARALVALQAAGESLDVDIAAERFDDGPSDFAAPSSSGSGEAIDFDRDRKSTRLNSSHSQQSRMPSSA